MEKEKEGGGRDIERGEELLVVVPWRESKQKSTDALDIATAISSIIFYNFNL